MCLGLGLEPTVLVLQTQTDQTGALRWSQEAWGQLSLSWHFSPRHCLLLWHQHDSGLAVLSQHCGASLLPSCRLFGPDAQLAHSCCVTEVWGVVG